MFLICMQLGLLLPPHGLLLMTMRGVAPPSVTMAHIFVAELPTWAGIHDALPQFPGREPGR